VPFWSSSSRVVPLFDVFLFRSLRSFSLDMKVALLPLPFPTYKEMNGRRVFYRFLLFFLYVGSVEKKWDSQWPSLGLSMGRGVVPLYAD